MVMNIPPKIYYIREVWEAMIPILAFISILGGFLHKAN